MAKTFKSVVEDLQRRLATNSVYSYWLRFEAGSLVLDTSIKGGTNLFMSFENKKSGVGKANCFTLNVAYAPSVTFTDDKFGDPNYIDKCLVANTSWECKLKYGYDHNPDNLVTKEYTGLILNYTKEINNGMLFYTITGYSNLVENVEDKITDGVTISNMRATEAAVSILNKYVKGYVAYIDDSAKDKDKVIEKIEVPEGTEIFKFVGDLLKNAEEGGDDGSDKDNPKERAYYTYIIDDINKKIKIIRVDKDSTYEAQIIFNWMDKSNSIVQSFKPNYDGTVLRTLYKDSLKSESESIFERIGNAITEYVQKVVNFMTEKSVVLGSSGEPVPIDELKESLDVADTADSDLRIEKSAWTKALRENTYKATMITIGIPYDIEILSCIEVIPLIYGNKDLSSGKYLITSVVDNIDSGGFNTTMEMMKIGW